MVPEQKEFEEKLKRVRGYLAKNKGSGMLLKRQDNFAWLTCGGKNYVGPGDGGNCALLVLPTSLHYITSIIENERMCQEERLPAFGFEGHSGAWYDSSFEQKTVASLVDTSALFTDMPLSYGKAVGEDIKRMRAGLTEGEIERYRYLGDAVSSSLESVLMQIKPGDTEYSIVGMMHERVIPLGIDVFSMMCASDERIDSFRHPVPTMAKVRERVQVGGNFKYKGLYVCLSRFAYFMPIGEKLTRQFIANQEIDCIFMANSRPGNTYSDVLAIGKEAYQERGYAEEFEKHHQGGPIGYAARDYRVDFTHRIPIVEHQAFCWNPSITGTKSEDTIISGSEGFEIVTQGKLFPTREIDANGKTYRRVCALER